MIDERSVPDAPCDSAGPFHGGTYAERRVSKKSVPKRELLVRLLPMDRLDERGMALFREMMACVDDTTLLGRAVELFERLCEQGYMRRLSRTASDGFETLRYRNLLTLDTMAITVPLAPPPVQPAPAAGPDGEAEPTKVEQPASGANGLSARDRAPRGVLTMPFLRAVAASSRRTDLAGAIGYLYDLLMSTTGCDEVALAMSRPLANSQAGNLTEFADVCASAEEEQVAPPQVREKVESSGEPLSIVDIRGDSRYARYFSGRATGSVVVAPLKAEAYVYGTLGVWSARDHAFDANAVAVVDFIAEFTAGLIKRRLEVEELIFIDQTCQIHNRRYFDEQIEREMERSRRTGNAMALLIGDLDDFKRVNDTLGHAAGDSVLRQVGKILSENARQVDIVARYGGEEFGVILPGVSRESALIVAERMRSAIAMHSFITGSSGAPTWDLTISIGVAIYPLDASSKEDLMDKADRIALYRAKSLGKNRVVMYQDTQD
jgi:diguanylate cyclase (GGDEF)-like protein